MSTHPRLCSPPPELLETVAASEEYVHDLVSAGMQAQPDAIGRTFGRWYLADVVELPFAGRDITYLRFRHRELSATLRLDQGRLIWGPIGSVTDPVYDAMAQPFAAWLADHPGAGLAEKLGALRSLYRTLRPASRPRIVPAGGGCPICDGVLPSGGTVVVGRCPSCGLLFQNAGADLEVAAAYALEDGRYFNGMHAGDAARWHGYEFYEEWVDVILGREFIEERADLFTRLSGTAAGSVLEVGCATGDLLAAMRARRWTVTGVDQSPHCVRRAREKHGLEVLQGAIFSAAPDQVWDLVVYMDVFEHVADPERELQEIRARLRPGGALVLELPNQASADADICGQDYLFAEHLFFYRPGDVVRLLERSSFQITALLSRHDSFYRIDRFLTPAQGQRLVQDLRGERLIVAARAQPS